MIKKSLIAALAACTLPLLAQADDYIQPGQWEQTIHITTANGKTLPDKTSKTCVKPEDAAHMREALLKNQGDGCKVADYNRDGDVVSWKVACSGTGHNTTTSGKMVRESATAYTMTMDTSMTYGGKTSKTHITGDAKRLGNCP